MQWTTGAGPETARPSSVEGFLPISALMGLKRLLLTGEWDPVHPAGLAILVCALLMAWMFRKGFCGYICPAGFVTNLLESLGRGIGLALVPPRLLDNALNGLKYLLLAFFLYTTATMPLAGIEQFLRSPYNLTADARMLAFFASPGGVAVGVLAGLAVLSVVVRNFWCRYCCPYGALLGLASLLSPIAVVRDPDSCVNCAKCSKSCPGAIDVEMKTRVSSPECIGCAVCIASCPVQGCLSLRAGKQRLPYWTIATGSVAILLGGWLLASATGHWDNSLPENMLKMLYGRVG